MQIVSSGLSDVGRVRTNNEDSFRIVEPLDLFILSDGMGGEAHGEVASAMAVDIINKYCEGEKEDSGVTVLDATPENWTSQTRAAAQRGAAGEFADIPVGAEESRAAGHGSDDNDGMAEGIMLSVAHVGDSRAYLLRSGNLQQLTNDHSLVAEQVRRGLITPQQAEESEMQSVLLRALGANPEVEMDVDEVEIYAAGRAAVVFGRVDAHGDRAGDCRGIAGGNGAGGSGRKADGAGERDAAESTT